MKFIHHIADIHIKASNNENLKNSFKVLIEQKPELLVIAGDLFHDKGKIAPNDIEFINWLYALLTENKIRTIIIPGNHDTNMNDLDNKKSNITKTVKNTEYVNCYDESTIITIDNVEFYLFSILDRKLLKPNDNKLTKVMVLHETVPNKTFTTDFMSLFDMVMLGDLHNQHEVAKNIIYPGSFVQNNIGESVKKGYIIWDINSLTHKFVPIPLKNIQLKLKAENNNCKLPTVKSNITRLRLEYNNCDSDYINKLKQTIVANYGSINEIINNTYSPIVNTKHEIIKLDNDKLFDERIKDPVLLAKIKKLHGELTIKLPVRRNFKILYMVWNNVLTYKGLNYIDFRECINKTILIDGANASGKSSIIDIIYFALFNEVYRGKVGDMLNQESNNGMIKLVFTIDIDEYTLEIILYKGKTSVVHLLKNNKIITCDNKIATYKYIEEDLGVGNAANFMKVNAAIQNRENMTDLSTSGKQETTALLGKMTGMDDYKLLTEKVKLDVKEYNARKKVAESSIKVEIQEKAVLDLELLLETKTKEKNKVNESLNYLFSKLEKLQIKYDSKLNSSYTSIEIEPGFVPTLSKEVALENTSEINIDNFKDVDFENIKNQAEINYEEQINNLQIKIDTLNVKLDSKIVPSNLNPKNGTEVSDEIINKFDSLPPVDLVNTLKEYESRLIELTTLKQSNNEKLKTLYGSLKHQKIIPDKSILFDKQKYQFLSSKLAINPTINKYEYNESELSKLIKMYPNFDKLHPKEIDIDKPDDYGSYEKYKKYLIDTIIATNFEFNPECKCCKLNKPRISSDSVKYNKIKDQVALIERYNEAVIQNDIYKIHSMISNKLRQFEEVIIRDNNAKINKEIDTILSDNIDEKIEELKSIIKLFPIYSQKNNIVYTKQLKSYNQYKIKIELDEYNKQLTELKILYKKQQSDNLLIPYEFHVKHYKTIEFYKLELIKNNKKVYDKMIQIKEEVKNKKDLYDELNNELIKINKDLFKSKIDYDNYVKNLAIIEECNEELKLRKEYLEHISDNGIPKQVYTKLCETLTEKTNQILLNLNSNFKVLISFDKYIDIILIDDKTTITSERASGFQKFAIDFILRIVMASISNVSNCGIIFIDEGFSSLDSNNLRHLSSMLNSLRSNFDTLFIITHLDDLKSHISNRIAVKRGIPLRHGYLTEDQLDSKTISNKMAEILSVEKFKKEVILNTSNKLQEMKLLLMPEDDNTSLTVDCKCGKSHKRLIKGSYNLLKIIDNALHRKLIKP